MTSPNKHVRTLLTIITEAALENSLIRDFKRLGAKGHTITEARGSGDRGVRNAGWESNSNIRIEVICTADVAQAITTYLEDHYYANYAMVMFSRDVNVLRPDKF